jgi:tetratricopeptide (TPR) repeat protein
LENVSGLADEIIVVDTGSTDRTREIAAAHGARVYEFQWIDDFGAARNESLRHASGDWIFWLDADDRVDEANRRRLVELFRALPRQPVAYAMRYSCWMNPHGMVPKRLLVDQVRLFPNDPQIRWSQRVHEQILPAVQALGGACQQTDIIIDHLGYQDEHVRQRKHERNLRLLRLEVQEQPDHPFTLFNLGWALLMAGQPDEAISCLKRYRDKGRVTDTQAAKAYVLLAQAQRGLGRAHEALQECQQGRRLFPDDPELLFTEGLLYYQLGDSRQAASRLEELLQLRPSARLVVGVDDGLTSYLARHNLAVIYRDQGQLREAECQWRAVLQQRPRWGEVLVGLGELYVVQKRWADLHETCRRLDEIPAAKKVAAELRARGHLGRGEFATTRRILEKVVAEWPAQIWPKVLFSRVLLQQGWDWAAAEKTLRDILALDPRHKEATLNLATLRAERRKALKTAKKVSRG